MPRKYEKVKDLLPLVIKMQEEGKSYRQIAEELKLGDDHVVRNLLYRAKHLKEKAVSQKTIPKSRGRKPAKTLQEYKYENKRLKMEVELLRDFLWLIGKE